MKPVLWVGLLLAVGLSIYVSIQEDDDATVTAVSKRDTHGSRAVRGVAGKGGATVARADAAQPLTPLDQVRLEMIVTALEAWRLKNGAADKWPELGLHQRAAWASQVPPPPPVMAPPPPPPPPPLPMAPAFPHSWVGRFVDGSSRAVIEGAMQTWVVKVNDVIEGQWRVDAIGEQQLGLTYLPLQQSQTVNMKR
jgi:hypothetical protein